MDNTAREELLLEVIRDFTGITYPEYADDENIKEKIYDYIYYLKKFKENNNNITFDEFKKLNKLHKFFYGVSFNKENPNESIYKTPIYDNLKLIYSKIDSLINETNDINADLLKSLLNIISVYYNPNKNKDAIISEYLDKIIIPVLNKYKGIGIVADSSLKEDNIDEIKSNIGKNILTDIKEKKEAIQVKTDEKDKLKIKEQGDTERTKIKEQGETERTKIKEQGDTEITKIKEQGETERTKIKEQGETERTKIKEQEDTGNVKVKKQEDTERTKIKEQGETERTKIKEQEDTGNFKVKKQEDNEIYDNTTIEQIDTYYDNDDKVKKLVSQLNNTDETIHENDGNYDIISEDTDKININRYDYNLLKEYLQALYLQIDIDNTKIEFINIIISKINNLKILDTLEDFNKYNDYLQKINKNIDNHLKKINFDINKFLDKYNENYFTNEENDEEELFKILLLFKSNLEGNYLISLYNDNNLKLLSKLFNYPFSTEINVEFYQDQLNFLIKKLINAKSNNILTIIENLRLLINLIIYHNKYILLTTYIEKCEINNLPHTYENILKILDHILNKSILKGGEIDFDLNQKKINYINSNLLFTLINNNEDNKNEEDIIKIFKILIKNFNDDNNIKKIIENLNKNKNTLDFKKYIILEIYKNINRIFKDENNKEITEENIIKNLCENKFNLDYKINKKKLKDLIKLKELTQGKHYYYFTYKLHKTIKNTNIINNIEDLLKNKNYCKEKYYLKKNVEVEVEFKDIIYIENSNYNLPIFYDDKIYDSYDIIDLIFKLLNTNDDNDQIIKKILLDFNNKFTKIEQIITDLKKLDIKTNLIKQEKIEENVKNINNVDDTKICYEYMKHNINYYKTKIATILSKYNLPIFYLENVEDNTYTLNDNIFNNSIYVNDNILNKNFLELKIKQYEYDNSYDLIEKYLTFKKLDYINKNEDLEEVILFNNENLDLKKIIKMINDNKLNLNDKIVIKYKFYSSHNVRYCYYKIYKCKIRDILTLNLNQFFNYYEYNDEPKYDLKLVSKSTILYLSPSDNFENLLFYLYIYLLNNKIEKINYKSKIYDYCIKKIKEDIKDFFNKKKDNSNLIFKKNIWLIYFEKIEEAKENLEYNLKKILKKDIEIDLDKSYEDIIYDKLSQYQDLYKYLDIKQFDSNIQKKLKDKLTNKDINYSFSIKVHKKKFLVNDSGNDFKLIDFIKLNDDNINISKDILNEINNENQSNSTYDSYEDEEEYIGGYKNIIELEDVFKLYYNSDESITNIYKLYFIINIYGYYYKDDKDKYVLIENILEIIKIDIINDDIIETIKNLITNIYYNSIELYENYIRYFDKTDTIIKNYCQTRELINKYLNMNFIYELYKNYQKKDIKIEININGTILKIDKSLKEINKEIDEIFINGEGLFPKSSYEITMNSYDNEIDNFIHFIYDFTKNQSTIKLTNLNDLNAFIVLQLLSNENEMIKLIINDNIYMIKNINNHPYKLHMTENFQIEIKLNDIQMSLYKKLFEMENRRSLLGILAKEYYYLDFNIQENSKFKFHLNYEIIPFISLSKIDDNFKRTIINYNSYRPKMIDEIKDLSILSLEKNSIIFLINYGILLASTIFSQINMKNFISLIHIYLIIKNNTKRYLNLYNYKGDNKIIIIYRDYIKTINYIGFLKSILFLMRLKIDLKMNYKNFIKSIINYKENNYIKGVIIKIDENFIEKLYNIKSYEIDKKIIEDFYLSFLLLYKNCLKSKIDNKNIINMFHIFIIPSLRFFHNKINIKDIENEVLDIKASEYIRLIKGIRGGDGDIEVDKPILNIDVNKAKDELKKEDNVELTTDLTDNTKDILKLLQVFNDFYIEFNKLDLNELLIEFEKIINELFLISEEKDEKYYIINENKLKLFDDKLDYKKDKKSFFSHMRNINDKIENNMRNLKEVMGNFSYNLYKEKEKRINLNDKSKNLGKILEYIDIIDNSLSDEINGIKKYKDKSLEVNNLFIEFSPIDDNEIPLMDKIKEFITYYQKKFDKFLSIIIDAQAKYDAFKKLIDDHFEKANTYFKEEEIAEINNKKDKINELKSKNKDIEFKKNNLNKKIEDLTDKIKKIEAKIEILKASSSTSKETDIKTLNDEILLNRNLITDTNNEIQKLDKENQENMKQINEIRDLKGGAIIKDKNIEDLLNKNPFKYKEENISFEDRKNQIKKQFDNIKKDYRRLKVSTYIPKSVNKDLILEKFINKKGDTLFEQILNNYQNDVKEKNQDIAKANFYESVENNNLDPIKELEITFIDKLIFAFLIIFLRYAGLYITYKLIDNKFIKSIKEAIIYYSLSYVAVLFMFIFIVNIDLFRLRIIFNYCNLHINSTGILSHMIIKIIIGYVIYLLIINIENEPIPTYLSKNQNIKLKKKLDILSMIVVIFLLIFVLII